jgi:hypothetical protein
MSIIPEEISVGSLDIGVGLNEGLPLLDHGPQLVGGQAHAVEVGEAVLALHIFAEQLELLERPFGVLQNKIIYLIKFKKRRIHIRYI